MKRPRPYIPWSVRYVVITRQCHAAGFDAVLDVMCGSAKVAAETNLRILFGTEKPHLDHNPALILRDFDPFTGTYSPAANDPEYLIYRTKQDHRTKTIIRGERGQFSDITLMKRSRRQARKANGTARPKAKIANRKTAWPSRPFPERRTPR